MNANIKIMLILVRSFGDRGLFFQWRASNVRHMRRTNLGFIYKVMHDSAFVHHSLRLYQPYGLEPPRIIYRMGRSIDIA